jgi:hypothetical protein
MGLPSPFPCDFFSDEGELRGGPRAAASLLLLLLLAAGCWLLAAGCWLLPSLPLGLRVGAPKRHPLLAGWNQNKPRAEKSTSTSWLVVGFVFINTTWSAERCCC